LLSEKGRKATEFLKSQSILSHRGGRVIRWGKEKKTIISLPSVRMKGT